MPTALVIGGAECAWDDAYRALELFKPDAFAVVNDMLGRWPLRIDYGCTLHPDKLGEFLRGRRGPLPYQIWSHRAHKNAQRRTTDWAGSSGLFAVKVLREENFDAIVVAGVPMVDKAGHIVRKETWPNANMFRGGWKKRFGEIEPYVRSMSGWTMELLGPPTPEWLSAHHAARPDHEMVRKLREMADGRIKDSA